MRTLKSISQIQKIISLEKGKNKTIGFVPTMGALHEGHLSLIRKSRRENDIVVCSIFVNPTQFGPNEDLGKYPRTLKKDKLLLQKEKTTLIFLPTEKIMYPSGYLTFTDVEGMTENLCAKSRPGHFRGVTTIVNKLLNIVQPDRLYLGQKDAQQALIIKKMIKDLNIPVVTRICPTVREKDGLALSSRNRYLSQQERKEAPALYQSLKNSKKLIRNGEVQSKSIIRKISTTIGSLKTARIDYIECVDAETLQSKTKLSGKVLIALAVHFGNARLIDNIIIQV